MGFFDSKTPEEREAAEAAKAARKEAREAEYAAWEKERAEKKEKRKAERDVANAARKEASDARHEAWKLEQQEKEIARKEEREAKKADAQAKREQVNAHHTAIRERLYWKIGKGGLIWRVAEHMKEGEEVLFAGTGVTDPEKDSRLVVATDSRIIVATQGSSGGMIELPYSSIHRTESGHVIDGSWVALYAGPQVIKTINSFDKLDALGNIIIKRQSAVSAPTPSAPAVSGAEEVKKLAELHAQGILSDDEFAAAKAKALGL